MANGRRDSGVDRGALGCQPAVQGRAGGMKTTRDRRHLIGGLGGHGVVDLADLVDSRRDAIERKEVVPLIVTFRL